VLAAFQNVADTLASLEEDANALAQSERAENAAHDLDHDAETRYHLGAAPEYAALTAHQQYESTNVQYVRARAARLADTAALFVSMGNPRAGQPAASEPADGKAAPALIGLQR
jgi:outer membrane protein TolC